MNNLTLSYTIFAKKNMIQRVQTVYLLLALICLALLFWFPIFTVEIIPQVSSDSLMNFIELKGEFSIYGLNGDFPEGEYPLYLGLVLLQVLTLAGILLYKNRKRQLLVCRLNFLLTLIFVAAIYFFYYLGPSIIEQQLSLNELSVENIHFYMAPGFFMVVPPVAFLILAIRGIKRDENLLKAIERIR